MRVGLTYDLRSDYLALGYSLEATAEFDKEETVASLEAALQANGYQTCRIGHARNLISRLETGERWELVFNICEGLAGVAREAQVPAILDLYGVPYVFSDALVLALTLHKGHTKRVVRDAGIPTSPFVVYNSLQSLESLDFAGPYFIKPLAEGTGKGCSEKSVVHERQHLAAACDELFARFAQPVLVERWLTGREFTVGITGSGADAQVVGSMEVLLLPNAEAGGYSYENKADYLNRIAYEKTTPASDPTARAAEDVALRAWRVLECRDGGRVDIRCDGDGQPQFLEVNPLAGLNEQDSDLPILARMHGVEYRELIGRIMRSALKRLKS